VGRRGETSLLFSKKEWGEEERLGHPHTPIYIYVFLDKRKRRDVFFGEEERCVVQKHIYIHKISMFYIYV